MIQESGTTWDSEAYKTVASSKCDGIFGSILLFVGFIYQTLGYADAESKTIVSITFLALIVFLIAYSGFLRGWLIKKWVADIEVKLSDN